MTSEADNRGLFDHWAETYDQCVHGSVEFPLTGYDQVLSALLSRANVEPGMSVLDLGTGTGNLAGLFLAQECSVWATDFSPRMIELARGKYPGIQFSIKDLVDGVPASFPERYDRIVSAYAFHHLRLPAKMQLIQDLAQGHLLPGGRLLIADVSFPTDVEREQMWSRHAGSWDPDEHYWAADETSNLLLPLRIETIYEQISCCGGVYSIQSTP